MERISFWIFSVSEDGNTLTRIKTDPKGEFLPPIGAHSELQAVAFYVKKVLKFEGSENENRAEFLKYRALPITLGVDKFVELTAAPVQTSEQRQRQLFDRNAQLL